MPLPVHESHHTWLAVVAHDIWNVARRFEPNCTFSLTASSRFRIHDPHGGNKEFRVPDNWFSIVLPGQRELKYAGLIVEVGNSQSSLLHKAEICLMKTATTVCSVLIINYSKPTEAEDYGDPSKWKGDIELWVRSVELSHILLASDQQMCRATGDAVHGKRGRKEMAIPTTMFLPRGSTPHQDTARSCYGPTGYSR